jgi:hypothetical protein
VEILFPIFYRGKIVTESLPAGRQAGLSRATRGKRFAPEYKGKSKKGRFLLFTFHFKALSQKPTLAGWVYGFQADIGL